jgi:hypothetical protein
MANFTAADVKKLRELTAAGMMDCKNALTEADGDLEKAVEILRVKGQKGVTKREGRSASNGAVVSLIAADISSHLRDLIVRDGSRSCSHPMLLGFTLPPLALPPTYPRRVPSHQSFPDPLRPRHVLRRQ